MSLLNDTKRLLHIHKIRPKRKLGQSFCVDADLLRRMVGYSGLDDSDTVLEVGAGFGFLTKILSEAAERVITIELDPRLVRALRDELKDRGNVIVIEGDVLKTSLPRFDKVVANPPYSISSQLIFKLLERDFDNAVLALQKEFAERLTAQRGNKKYGRLTVMAYHKADVEALERVPEDAFYPSPEVESVVVRVKPRESPFKVADENFFSELVRALFTQRNKKMKHALLAFIRKKIGVEKEEARILIEDLPHLDDRVYKLSPEDFGALSNEIFQRIIKKS